MGKAAIKLDHCVIHVSDWARSNDFYARVFGMEVIKRGKVTPIALAPCS